MALYDHGHFWTASPGQDEEGRKGQQWVGKEAVHGHVPWRATEGSVKPKSPFSGSQAESIRTATRHLFLHIFRTSYTPTSYSSQDGTQNKLNLKLLMTFYFLSGHGEKGQNSRLALDRVGGNWALSWKNPPNKPHENSCHVTAFHLKSFHLLKI